MFCIYIFREGDALVKDSETLIAKVKTLIKFSRFFGKKMSTRYVSVKNNLWPCPRKQIHAKIFLYKLSLQEKHSWNFVTANFDLRILFQTIKTRHINVIKTLLRSFFWCRCADSEQANDRGVHCSFIYYIFIIWWKTFIKLYDSLSFIDF